MNWIEKESTWISDSHRAGARRWMIFAEQIRQAIEHGRVLSGRYLPGERPLATQYGISVKTVRRGLAALADEGLLTVEKRKGYRVTYRDDKKSLSTRTPLAFVFRRLHEQEASWFYRRILGELQMAADRQGYALLGMNGSNLKTGEVIQRLKTAQAGGVVLDADEGDLLSELAANEIPVTLADIGKPDSKFDSVMQDGLSGGLAAGRWLVSRGHKRVVLLHHELCDSIHAVSRYGGVAAGLATSGIFLTSRDLAHAKVQDEEQAYETALRILSSRNRPTGFLALWQGMGVAVARAAARLKLQIGHDFDLVSWSTYEDYDTYFAPQFSADQTPAAIVWRVSEMASHCISLLVQRRANPALPAMHVSVETRLLLPGGKED